MSNSKSIKNITVGDAMSLINDQLVNSIIDGDYTVEEVTENSIMLLISGLYFKWLHYKSLGELIIFQNNHYKTIDHSFILTYDKDTINPILEYELTKAEKGVKLEQLKNARKEAFRLEHELELAS